MSFSRKFLSRDKKKINFSAPKWEVVLYKGKYGKF